VCGLFCSNTFCSILTTTTYMILPLSSNLAPSTQLSWWLVLRFLCFKNDDRFGIAVAHTVADFVVPPTVQPAPTSTAVPVAATSSSVATGQASSHDAVVRCAAGAPTVRRCVDASLSVVAAALLVVSVDRPTSAAAVAPEWPIGPASGVPRWCANSASVAVRPAEVPAAAVVAAAASSALLFVSVAAPALLAASVVVDVVSISLAAVLPAPLSVFVTVSAPEADAFVLSTSLVAADSAAGVEWVELVLPSSAGFVVVAVSAAVVSGSDAVVRLVYIVYNVVMVRSRGSDGPRRLCRPAPWPATPAVLTAECLRRQKTRYRRRSWRDAPPSMPSPVTPTNRNESKSACFGITRFSCAQCTPYSQYDYLAAGRGVKQGTICRGLEGWRFSIPTACWGWPHTGDWCLV